MLVSYGLIMEYDPLGPVPRYQQIAGILRGRIEAGELEPDRPIPSETAIQQEFGVARATARHAVELLREWGLSRDRSRDGHLCAQTLNYLTHTP